MGGEPLFGPETVTWKVNREGVLLAGGGRALMLQVGHPLVAAGVEQHSDYDINPWDRLYRTLDTTLKISFAEREAGEEAASRLRRVHNRVKGSAPDGTPYDARQQDLLLWVWATLLDTSLLIYGRYMGRLSAAEKQRFYEEQTLFLRECGGSDRSWPEDFAAFGDYFETMVADTIHPTADSRKIADSVLKPKLPLALRPLTVPLNLVTVGLLPQIVRDRYGFEWSSARERALAASTAVLRPAMKVIPRSLRQLPASYAATHPTRPLPGSRARRQAAA